MNDESEEGGNPPSPNAVAFRALVLCSLACRAHLELGPDDPDAIDVYQQLVRWCQEMDLWTHASTRERAQIETPLGSLARRDGLNMGWHAEGLLVLVWALGLVDLHSHDTKVDLFDLADALHFLGDDARSIVEQARLRDREALRACREFHYALHVRLRSYERDPVPRDIVHDFDGIDVEALGLDLPLSGTDLRIGSGPMAAAPPKLITQSEEIVRERHRASIWVIGEEGPDYHGFPLDT
ncbi:MAG: DUF4272 domain-containing protein [Planctomycetes bacterium]|nr:DUF4272 domain-containing protein [Planctomycetota bacterium]